MCRNKILGLLLTATLSLTLTACSMEDVKSFFVTDTGSGSKNSIEKEDYLDTDALKNGVVTSEEKYKTVTLEYTDVTSDALKQQVRRSYTGGTIYLDAKGNNMKFGDYLKSNGEEVHVGDEVAYIYTEVDDISIKEAETKLTRLEEAYQRAVRDNEKEISDLKDELAITYNTEEQEVMKVQLEQLALDRTKLDYDYQEQIADQQEKVKEMTEVGQIYYIKSDKEGYMITVSKVTSGKEIKYGDYICSIINKDEVVVSISNQAEYFTYNSVATMGTKIGNVDAVCVSGGMHALYGNLDTGDASFKLVDDGSGNFKELTTNFYDAMTFNGTPISLKNVLTVPKDAVEVTDDSYYVTVLKDDGTLLTKPFVPGGSTTGYYWVLEGLEAGETIVYN